MTAEIGFEREGPCGSKDRGEEGVSRSFRLRLFGRWFIGAPTRPAPTDFIIRLESPLSDGTFHRFNHRMASRDEARSFAGRMRRNYALGDGSSYPIAIIGVRWKGADHEGP